MGSAIERLSEKVALAIQVKAYLKRSPSGHIEPVVAHERTGQPAAPPGITPLKPLGPPLGGLLPTALPTPTAPPAPAREAPEPRTAPSRWQEVLAKPSKLKVAEIRTRGRRSKSGAFPKATAQKRADAIAQQVASDFGMGPVKVQIALTEDEWKEMYTANRNPDAGSAYGGTPEAFYRNGTMFIGNNIADDLRDPEGGAWGGRVVAHEMLHGVSGEHSGMGLSPIVEEGAAEILSTAWAKDRFDDEFKNLPNNAYMRRVGDKVEKVTGDDFLIEGHTYPERIIEDTLHAAMHVGFDREKVLDEVLRIFKANDQERSKWFGPQEGDAVSMETDTGIVRFYLLWSPTHKDDYLGRRRLKQDSSAEPLAKMQDEMKKAGIDIERWRKPPASYKVFEDDPEDYLEELSDRDATANALLAWLSGVK